MHLHIEKRKNIKIFVVTADAYKIKILNLGASIWQLETKDRNGLFENIVLSHPTPEDYFNNDGYYGTTIGRHAGRIANGKFAINNQTYHVPTNDGPNNLHSSGTGVSQRIFEDVVKIEQTIQKIIFKLQLKEIDDGFPGSIHIKITYSFFDNYFEIKYTAQANQDTLCNLTNHSYFNLSGNLKHNIKEHQIYNGFEAVWQLDPNNIPITRIKSHLFFTKQSNSINELEIKNQELLRQQNGIDHPFQLDENKEIFIKDHKSGRNLKMRTSYPVVVLYTHNFPTKTHSKVNMGIAIEPQFCPNDINYYKNPHTLLKRGQKYNNYIKYYFKNDFLQS